MTVATEPAIDRVLDLLRQRGEVVQKGREWRCVCPAHDDAVPSLDVSVGSGGRVLLQCRARNCDHRDICRALGLSAADLFDATDRKFGFEERVVRTYDYRDEAGEVLFQAVRLNHPKDFRQRHAEGNGRWAWNLKDVRRVVYRLPELLAADPATPVFICEGEKDADALAGCGLVATTNPMGAGKWKREFAAWFAGRHVVILPDNDDAGRDHAAQVRASLAGVAASVRVVELPDLPPKGDVSDWLDEQLSGSGEAVDRAAAGATLVRLVGTAGEGKAKPATAEVKPVSPPAPPPSPPAGGVVASPASNGRLTNYRTEPGGEGEKPRRVGLHPADVVADLYRLTGGWPRRVGGDLFAVADGPAPRWIDSPDALFAEVAGTVGAGSGVNPVEWAGGSGLATKAEFFEFLRQRATGYEAVEAFPHEPPLPGHFYLHPPAAGGDGAALAGLLARFRPATPADADLIRAFFLTLVWGGPAGARPAWLFTGADGDEKGNRGIGKTTVAKLGAALVGGSVSIQASTDDINKIKGRLLSPGARGLRLVLIDNVKSPKFSWGDIEAQITEATVSGHQLYAGEGRRPNTLVFVITLNGASLSKDLAQRCVVVKLARPVYSATWEEDALAYVEANRWAILGDLVAALRRPAPAIAAASRWGTWERHVLSRVSDPAACQAATAERQDEVDEDQEGADRVRAEFHRVIRDTGHDPDTGAFRFDSAAVVEIVTRARAERQTATAASGHLKAVALPELVKKKYCGLMQWWWFGRQSVGTHGVNVVFETDGKRFRFGGVPE